ncbi:MAG: cyclodeaminase/cyclohydrolase family protein [Lachnospiraceae bacterium]|nr:cyclodeaminase/cyclohydrolase family protein [Lachnospiraceae bacterium]MBR5375771.1 cyclodeaminase/cyclohydrolase family protein [Lachnospiraceae bacterium]
MTDSAKMSIDDFIKVLSSSEPVPGGGGASGLVAAVGMSLGNMVLALTTGKKKYAQYQQEIEESMIKANELTDRLLLSVDKDAEAFEPLSKAYSLPKVTDAEKAYRDEVMEKALHEASEAPLAQMKLILDAMMLIQRISQIGSTLAISDAGAAVQFAFAALKASSLNVYINTKLMKDRTAAKELNERAGTLTAQANVIYEETFERVLASIKGGNRE